MFFPSFSKISINFNKEDPSFKYFKNVWDSYCNWGSYAKIPARARIIPLLKKYFPESKDCQYMKPLGDFKDLAGVLELERESIYEQWCDKFEKKQKFQNGSEKRSMLEVAIAIADAHQLKVFGFKKFSKAELVTGCAMMLWRCTEGVVLEVDTIRHLKSIYDNEFVEVVPAQGWMESQDVDALIIDRASKKNIMYISIKTLGAITQQSVNRFRYERSCGEKKAPMFYCGFNEQGAFKIIIPKEWTREQLREHLDARRTFSSFNNIVPQT